MHFNTEIGVNNVPHDYKWYSSNISETHFLEIYTELSMYIYVISMDICSMEVSYLGLCTQ